MSESNILLFLSVFLILVAVICIIVEVVIVAYAYFTADEIECNWIWCSFKSGEGMIEQNTQCFKNGVKINCSGIRGKNNLSGIPEEFMNMGIN